MDLRRKGMLIITAAVFLVSTLYFTTAKTTFGLSSMIPDEEQLGKMCIRQVSAAARIDDNTEETSDNTDDDATADTNLESSAENSKDSAEKKENVWKKKLPDDPLVIIYHTHSSESYMPYKESNYHREEVKGTVREVGDVMEDALEKKGINVIHDKTVHDRPSYNESYSKSLSTIQSLIKKYPTAVYIIDLHRDAAAASATEGKYTVINGKRVAKFSMVVGQANENYVELYDFAQKVGKRAGEMYSGFGGSIIEQNYKYNEFVSNKALLLEVGNNKNTIEEANACGRYFAEVLADVIEEENR